METTVIFIGDSITEGIGASDTKTLSYPAQTCFLLGNGYRTVNCGRNGATLMLPPNGSDARYTEQPHFTRALKAAEAAAAAGDRIIVSVMLGTNDADVIDYGFRGTGSEYYDLYHDAFVGEMLDMTGQFRSISGETGFVIATSPYSYDGKKHKDFGNLDSVWRFQAEISENMREKGIAVSVCDMASATRPEIMTEENIGRYYMDRLHPNDMGHLYFAHFFADAVSAL